MPGLTAIIPGGNATATISSRNPKRAFAPGAARRPCSMVDSANDNAPGPEMTGRERIGRERMWKLVSTGTGMLAGLIVRKLMRAGYTAIRKDAAAASPFDPTKARFSWPDALVWAAAAGIGLGTAKVVSARSPSSGGRRPPAPSPRGSSRSPRSSELGGLTFALIFQSKPVRSRRWKANQPHMGGR